MLDRLLDVSEKLALTPPPSKYTTQPQALPQAANTLSSGCASCRGSTKEMYTDQQPGVTWYTNPLGVSPTPTPVQTPAPPQQVWKSTADDLLFADDEFTKGLVDTPAAAPYSNPLMNPGATAFAGSVNALDMSKALSTVTAPNNFKTAIGAQTLGAGTTSSFVVPSSQPTQNTPVPIASSTTTTWMPAGLTNTQAMVLATVVCTAILLLFFIIGMGTAPKPAAGLTDPLLGI